MWIPGDLCRRRVGLIGVLVLALGLLPLRTGATPSTPDLRRALTFLTERAAEQTFSGVVLVASDASAPVVRAYGAADFELGVPMRPNSVFAIASLTKLITAATVLRLVDRGVMNLNTNVCAFVKNCPSAWSTVTIEDLLDHSSAIPDLFESISAAPLSETLPAIDKMIANAPYNTLALTGMPQKEVAYSNFNYMLFGYAIEREAGMPWGAAVRSEVTAPLNMMSTQYDDPWAIIPQRVRGYTLNEQFLVQNVEYKDDSAYAAGGLLSDATDLYRFVRGVLGGPFLSDALRRRMLDPNSGGFGLGWQVTRFWNEPVYDLSGGTTGFTSHIAYYPNEGVTIVVLSNIDSGRDAISVSCDITALAFGKSNSVLRRLRTRTLLSPSVVGDYGGGRSITKETPPRYRDSKGDLHRLVVMAPTEAALADEQDVRLSWDSRDRAMSAFSCGRFLFEAPRTNDVF